jgi:hypothetical protein
MSRTRMACASTVALILLATLCSAVHAAEALEAGSLATGSRHLQTVIAQKVADNAQDRWWVRNVASNETNNITT